MKTLSIITAILSFMISTTALSAGADISDLRTCLQQMSADHNPQHERDWADRCYDKALPWAQGPSIQGRALYVQALQRYIGYGTTWSFFNSTATQLRDYYISYLDPEITPSALAQWSDDELSTVFEGVSMVELYTSSVFVQDPGLIKYVKIFETLEQRKHAKEEQAHYVYEALVAHGNWEEARAVLHRWPSLSPSPIPVIAPGEALSPDDLGYYVLSPDLKSMSLKKFDYNHGPKIVLSGFCHFAIDAVRILQQEKEIAALMRQYGIAINPNMMGDFDFKKTDELRKQFPDFEFHLVSSGGAWFQKGIFTLSSPTIHFLLDGVPKYTAAGATEYLVADFCRGLKSIGLKAPQSCGGNNF